MGAFGLSDAAPHSEKSIARGVSSSDYCGAATESVAYESVVGALSGDEFKQGVGEFAKADFACGDTNKSKPNWYHNRTEPVLPPHCFYRSHCLLDKSDQI